MGKHILGVDIIPTVNDQILHLFDTSAYYEGLGVSCNRLEIHVPGFRRARLIEPAQGFNLAINAIHLELISPEAGYLPPLPDGIYQIKYSVSPNEIVYVDFYHLRTTTFDKMIAQLRCDLEMSACSPTEDVRQNLLKIREIEDTLKVAIAAIDVDNDIDRAVALYTYSKQLFERYKKEC